MSVPVTLQGTVYQIPETNEKPWGATVTSLLQRLAQNLAALLGGSSTIPLLILASTDTTLAAAATLTRTHPWHRVAGSGGAVTLSATVAIANGTTNGEMLKLMGTHATNTVTILDTANVDLNGDITLGLNDSIDFIWDSALGNWKEICRSN